MSYRSRARKRQIRRHQKATRRMNADIDRLVRTPPRAVGLRRDSLEDRPNNGRKVDACTWDAWSTEQRAYRSHETSGARLAC